MKLDKIMTGVQHIGIPTADMAATEKFYLSLGFEKIFETLLDSGKVAFFSLNNVCFECYESNETAMKYGAVDHVSLNVTDVEEAYRQVLAGGCKVVSDGIEQLPFFANGVRFFTIEGPNKEKVEFNQYL